MKVFYKIEQKDVIRMIAEKYDIKDPESQIVPYIDNSYMIDMSETETPGETVPEKKEPEPTDEEQESRYKLITNEMLQALIVGGLTIPQICEKYDLKDSKYSARLYKRAEPFRKEEARLGRRKSNNTETEKA